jgi:CheY-like chemotaxis protein/HPt (histidine-containing phosphotransfer) domain-containing protein
LALINDILDFSKIESGKFQLEETNFELKSLLNSAVSIVDYSAKTKGLEIVTNVESNVPEFLVGDPLRLRQVLLNLLNNAIKFSDTGTIKLLVQKLTTGDDSQAKLLFEVIDQGVGFDNETRSKLFKSFSQGDNSMSRRYGGTGLGLAISKQIVELMSGAIDVESTKGVGSKFFFDVLLKVPKKDSTIQSISTMHTIPPLRGYILVAEDNRVNQKVVSEMLGLMGCTSQVVENGKEAIEALRGEDFDLVLMDAQMPVMDGYEATRLIRRGDAGTHHKNIPILATTANAIKGDIEACLEAGMNDYISKPIAYNDLAIKIEKWMARGQNVIDDTNLQKLREQGEKSGKEFITELVEIFKQDAPEAVAVMRSNLNAKLYKEIPAIAHNLKTSAGILGAHRLKEIAERIERSKMEPITEQQLALLVDSLDKELQLVLEHLDRYRSSRPPEAQP